MHAVHPQILDGLIAAAMAELHLIGLCPKGEREQLVPEADAKDRLLSRHLLNLRDNLRHILRVSRPVGQKNAVGIQRKHLLGTRVRRQHRDLRTKAIDILQNAALDAEVQRGNMRRVLLIRLHDIDFGRCNHCHEIARQLLRLQCSDLIRLRAVRDDHALHRAGGADMACHRSRVYVIKARNLALRKKINQALLGLPIIRRIAELTDDKAAHKGAAGLHKFLCRAIVPNQRVGHRENLSAERRVGQTFLIPCHGRRKDNLPHRLCAAVQQLSRIGRTVLQNQFSSHIVMTPSFITIFPSTTVSTAFPRSSRPTNGE